ncbi:MAG TPA: hypothetical protein VFS17_10450, partial [Methylophilaceae bacterium]|nr:hypothetical protein [Methylophilaceae bacterium]
MPDLLTLKKPAPALSATSDRVEQPASEAVDNNEPVSVDSEQAATEQVEKSDDSATSIEDHGDDTAAHDEGKPRKGVQKRIDELTRQRSEAERLAAETSQRLSEALKVIEKLTGDSAKEAQQRQQEADPKPTRDMYDDPDDYTAELAAWSGRQAVKAYQAEQQTRSAQATVEEVHQQRINAWNEGKSKAIEKYPDYVEVAESPDVPISQAVGMAIINAPNQHDVAYWLGKNKAEAARISALPPLQAAIEIGAISERLKAEKPK